jgi:hypothetical protein
MKYNDHAPPFRETQQAESKQPWTAEQLRRAVTWYAQAYRALLHEREAIMMAGFAKSENAALAGALAELLERFEEIKEHVMQVQYVESDDLLIAQCEAVLNDAGVKNG